MRRELEDLDELEEELEALEESREDSQPYNQPSYEPTTIRKSSSVVVMFRGTVVSDLVPFALYLVYPLRSPTNHCTLLRSSSAVLYGAGTHRYRYVCKV